MNKDIVLTVDYHPNNMQIRWLNTATGEERCFKRPTTAEHILRVVAQAKMEVTTGGRVVWIMESTSGWARVNDLLGYRVEFVLANVLQVSLPPKAYRRKTDKIDTERLQREYINCKLPRAYSHRPGFAGCAAWWTRGRTSPSDRRHCGRGSGITSITRRGTAARISGADGEWPGSRRWTCPTRPLHDDAQADGARTARRDAGQDRRAVAGHLQAVAPVQSLDKVRGIGPITAVTMLAYIGPIARFKTAEAHSLRGPCTGGPQLRQEGLQHADRRRRDACQTPILPDAGDAVAGGD